MKELAELIAAVASLLWPLFALIVFFSYRGEFRLLLRRVRRGKLLGQELELDDSLRELEVSAKAAIIEVATSAPTANSEVPKAIETADISVQRILENAARFPKAALLYLASEVEGELWRLLASTGWHEGKPFVSLKQGFDLLQQAKPLPPHIAHAVALFSDMRNKLVLEVQRQMMTFCALSIQALAFSKHLVPSTMKHM